MTSIASRFLIIFEGAWRRRYSIIVPALLLPILGGTIGAVAPKKYAAHTSMLIQETAKMNPFLEDLAISAMLKERFSALQTLLHSRHILSAVAMERSFITEDSSPEQRDYEIGRLAGALSMQMAGKDMIRIDYKASSPDGMKETLEAISNHFVEQLLAPERSSMRDSSYFLSEHLENRRQELDKAEQALAEYKTNNQGGLPELQMSKYARLAQLKQNLAEKEAEMAGVKKGLGSLDQQLSRTNPVVGRLEEQIVRIRGELALLRARYMDGHSKVQAAIRSLRRLEEERKNILTSNEQTVNTEQLWDIASSGSLESSDGSKTQPLLVSQLENLQMARNRVDSLGEETASLRRMITELEAQAAQFSEQEREISRLDRDIKIKRDLYDELLQRYEMARITGSLGIFEQEKRVKVIDRPFTPSAPTNLPPIVFVIAGFFGGLFLGGGIALVLELSDNTIRRRESLEALTKVPVLTRIPPMIDPSVAHHEMHGAKRGVTIDMGGQA